MVRPVDAVLRQQLVAAHAQPEDPIVNRDWQGVADVHAAAHISGSNAQGTVLPRLFRSFASRDWPSACNELVYASE
jgi:hypothetical protein